MAHIGADQILVNRDGRIVDGSIDTIALMVLTIQDQQCEIGDQGIAIKD
jgi:hypothetical protein